MRYATGLAFVVVAAVGWAGEASAQISHQVQDISDHVVLRDGSLSNRDPVVCPLTESGSFKGKGLFRVFPDGTLASDPFTVPAGRQLVITDVEWTVASTLSNASLQPGWIVRVLLRIGSGTTFNLVFLARTVQVGSAGGLVQGSEQLTTGFVVGPNTAICPGSAEQSSSSGIGTKLHELVLRGYLINAPH
jgi:hypothetical protein